MAGVEPELAHIEGALEEIALDPSASLSDARLDTLIGVARAARTRIREAAYQELHRNPYRPEIGPDLLARIPAELDALNEKIVVTVCSRLGLAVEQTRGRRTFAIELGNEALVDSLPGVPGGSSYVGSFDREEAVEDETIDFFASGHPLVEGVFAHVEDSPLGRVVRLEVEAGRDRGKGLVAIYKDGPGFDVVARDSSGRNRPDWAAAFRQRPLRARRAPAGALDDPASADMVRRLGAQLEPSRRPYALAAVVVRPRH
jgi:ATP-dependent helicase HepA